MGSLILRLLGPLALWAVCIRLCMCQEQPFVISSFSRPVTSLKPYDWTYFRVEIPPWFSSMVMTFVSDFEIDTDHMKQLSNSNLPLICFKDGSPPIPDMSNSYLDSSFSNFLNNGSSGDTQDTSVEQCISFQKNITMTLTNEQISSGVWYFGFFNGIGPARTQSKMINRGRAYMFSTNIIVRGCRSSTIWGPYCNQTIHMVSCSESSISSNLSDVKINKKSNLNHFLRNGGRLGANNHLPVGNPFEGRQVVSNSSMFTGLQSLITCKNPIESSCLGYGDLMLYFLDIVGIASQFKITATDFNLNQTSFMGNSAVSDGILLMCYARYNAMPLDTLHDHSADISRSPLTVQSPRIGRWYIALQVINQTQANVATHKNSETIMCFSFEWQVPECISGKAGVNCTWEAHMLQRLPRRGSSTPSESYYLPIDKNVPLEIDSGFHLDDEFSLDNLLSNSSSENATWTYFFLDIPRGAAGANMHVQLLSEKKFNYEIYSKYSGLASVDTWDYFVNSTNSSNGSTILTLNDSRDGKIEFYIPYAREGLWCFGLRHPPVTHYKQLTTMSISLEGCPKHCSSHGQCHYAIDDSGLTFYSYCTCDRDHGGFDCSNELVSHEGHVWRSIFLIASNVAAILPAFWALRQKAFAEWVLFTSSGISSALYHACDVGTWCALSFHVLQFMDFWLSFMAVASTFVYMATINEAAKRAIHTVVAIVTALLAVTGATRSENIALVIAIGALGLSVAWLLEFSTSYRPTYCSASWDVRMSDRWQNTKRWFWNLLDTLQKRFRWQLVLLGFIALAFAATSWKLETNESYWIWHSLWHISIYTSSFFFMWSMSVKTGEDCLFVVAVYGTYRYIRLRSSSCGQCQ